MCETQRKSPSGSQTDPDSDVSSERTLDSRELIATEILSRVHSIYRFTQVKLLGFVDRLSQMFGPVLMSPGYLDSLHVEDLYLAYACGCGNQAALHEFAQSTDKELRTITRRLHLTGHQFDDIRQVLWDKLFLRVPERDPRIFDYRGTGPLLHWFRVLATRTALDQLRSSQRQRARSDDLAANPLMAVLPVTDPELSNIRARYQGTFKKAFENAVQALTAEERNVLRCTYVAAMSTDEIGRAFGLHKATAARHVAKARDRLYQLTRRELKTSLGADTDELDSFIRLFNSELSVSLSRILK